MLELKGNQIKLLSSKHQRIIILLLYSNYNLRVHTLYINVDVENLEQMWPGL